MAQPQPPDLLFILSDEQRWDTLGCYGQALPVSPHLDRLAALGTRFAHAYTSSPLCGPARSSLQTGLYPSQSGCVTNNIALPRELPTIADRLHDAGYQTAYVGKWHLASDGHEGDDCYHTRPIPPERRGGWREHWIAADLPEFTSRGTAGWLFDADGEKVSFADRYRADAYTDLALDILQHRRDSRPLALMLSLVEPHAQPYHGMYQGPPGPRNRHEYREITYEGPDDLVATFADAPLPDDLRELPGPAAAFWPDYLAACAAVDANVGRLLATVDLAKTLVIFASDHGCHFFGHRPDNAKSTGHDASVRIPLIVAGAGMPAGRVVSSPVSLIDIPPTLLAAAGIPSAELAGHPLQEPNRPQPVRIELPGKNGQVVWR